MSKKLDAIRIQNAQWVKESPYNYCDRWCERCPITIKQGCRLYLDEVGRRAVNIAHGREPDDLRILEEELEILAQNLASLSSDNDFFAASDLSSSEEKEILDQKAEVDRKAKAHHLRLAVDRYGHKVREFLKVIGFPQKVFSPEIQYHLETIITVACEDEPGLYRVVRSGFARLGRFRFARRRGAVGCLQQGSRPVFRGLQGRGAPVAVHFGPDFLLGHVK